MNSLLRALSAIAVSALLMTLAACSYIAHPLDDSALRQCPPANGQSHDRTTATS